MKTHATINSDIEQKILHHLNRTVVLLFLLVVTLLFSRTKCCYGGELSSFQPLGKTHI